MATLHRCSNSTVGPAGCVNPADFVCTTCGLFAYCSFDCQQAHSAHHQAVCNNSVLAGPSWEPWWVVQGYTPAFMTGQGDTSFGPDKNVLGDVPAIDILRLGNHEGPGNNQVHCDLNVLLTASGDLRNVVNSIAHIPDDFTRRINFTINDNDLDVVGRNIILLLIAFVTPDVDKAVECMIHTWYSALIREADMIQLSRARCLVQAVCNSISSSTSQEPISNMWYFGQSTMNVALTKTSWDRLLTFFQVPAGLTKAHAHALRQAVTLAPSRQDYRDRTLLCQANGSHRVGIARFKKDGILAPFGTPRHLFSVPNPTIFSDTDAWPWNEDADPMKGWSPRAVRTTSSGPADNDLVGKLYCYLTSVFTPFVHKLKNKRFRFDLHHMDMRQLGLVLVQNKFDRIEVSNMCDTNFLGLNSTLAHTIPFLKPSSLNPHATLIMHFKNAVDEASAVQDESTLFTPQKRQMVLQYLAPNWTGHDSEFNEDVIRLFCSRGLVLDYGPIFARYMLQHQFFHTGESYNASSKSVNTLVPMWPARLGYQPPDPRAQREFEMSLGGGVTGKDRYVEWTKN